MAPSYQYSPLESPEHIRLVQIKPGTGEEPIVCEIHHVSLADLLVYEALSYTWDLNEAAPEFPRRYSIACGDFQISVAPNLFSALRRLRKDAGDLVLWADAICINQADNQERGHQVEIMHRIYSNCSRALVWLGESQPGDASALDLARKIAYLSSTLPDERQDRPPLIRDALRTGLLPPWEAPEWKALFSLLDKRWFHRVWVIQEATMAPHVLFNCGNHTLSLVSLLNIWLFLLEAAMFNNPFVANKPQGVNMLRTIRQVKDGSKKGLRLTTLGLLRLSRRFDATDPRDRFYGLLGLVQDRTFTMQPDYDSPPAKLFTEITRFSLINEKSVASLSFADPSLSAEEDNLPSWVPRYSGLSRSRQPFAEAGNTPFHTASEVPERFKPHRLPKICDSNCLLIVEAVEIDYIELLGGPYTDSPSSCGEASTIGGVNEWLLRDLMTWIEECEDLAKTTSLPDLRNSAFDAAFWHTITLNGLGIPGKPFSPSECVRNFDFFKELLVMYDGLSEDPLSLNEEDDISQERHLAANAFQLTIRLWRPRRLFGTTQKGYIGMFPEGAIKGDVVCAIMGAKTPFVIRPEEGGTYRFVGEAYVHGFMNGEIFDFPDFEESLREITLR